MIETKNGGGGET